MTLNDKIYQEVTDRIIAKLEEGTVPWQKPWTSKDGGFITAPRNLVSKKSYRGINVLMLATAGFSSPWWMTYKQASELGGNVKKGERSSIVVFSKKLEKTGKDGKPVFNDKGEQQFVWMLRYSRVFNLEQTEGISAPETEQPVVAGDAAEVEETDGIKKAKQIVKDANLCPIKTGGSVAAYSPVLDMIRMPKVKDFSSPAFYHHVLFHEMTHATGHASRLARFETGTVNGFGSDNYSKEELVAEIGASFLSNVAGIFGDVQFENAAGYIANWLKAFKDDPKMIVKAASAAQRAADLILNIK